MAKGISVGYPVAGSGEHPLAQGQLSFVIFGGVAFGVAQYDFCPGRFV
jgi:hypothetical protein